VEVDPQYFRPTEVEILLGDAEKAKQKIGWKPEYSIDELVEDMVEGDFKKLKGIPGTPEVSE
jgi:GDPmannose 4,6-dehydratase